MRDPSASSSAENVGLSSLSLVSGRLVKPIASAHCLDHGFDRGDFHVQDLRSIVERGDTLGLGGGVLQSGTGHDANPLGLRASPSARVHCPADGATTTESPESTVAAIAFQGRLTKSGVGLSRHRFLCLGKGPKDARPTPRPSRSRGKGDSDCGIAS